MNLCQVVRVNNRKINSAEEIFRVIDEGLFKVGDSIILTIIRENTFIE